MLINSDKIAKFILTLCYLYFFRHILKFAEKSDIIV
nr:MAG TPA: hypothetical protein [Bacteriophage sp.]